MLNALIITFLNEGKLLFRKKREWLTPLLFFILLFFLFPLAFPLDAEHFQTYLPGCLWIAALFANYLSLQTLFTSDLETDSLTQWALAPTPLTLLIIAKLAAHWVVTQLPLILLSIALACLLKMNLYSLLILGITLLLGTPVILLLGSLGIALSLGLKQSGLMLGIILFPLIIPLFIFSVHTILLAENGLPILHPLAAILGISILSMIGLPPAISAALRLSSGIS